MFSQVCVRSAGRTQAAKGWYDLVSVKCYESTLYLSRESESSNIGDYDFSKFVTSGEEMLDWFWNLFGETSDVWNVTKRDFSRTKMTTFSSSSAMNPDSSETSKDYGISILSSDLFKSLIRSDKFNLRSIAFSDDDDDYDAIAWLVFFLQRFPLNGQKHDADWSQRTFSLSLCDQTLWSFFVQGRFLGERLIWSMTKDFQNSTPCHGQAEQKAPFQTPPHRLVIL